MDYNKYNQGLHLISTVNISRYYLRNCHCKSNTTCIVLFVASGDITTGKLEHFTSLLTLELLMFAMEFFEFY